MRAWGPTARPPFRVISGLARLRGTTARSFLPETLVLSLRERDAGGTRRVTHGLSGGSSPPGGVWPFESPHASATLSSVSFIPKMRKRPQPGEILPIALPVPVPPVARTAARRERRAQPPCNCRPSWARHLRKNRTVSMSGVKRFAERCRQCRICRLSLFRKHSRPVQSRPDTGLSAGGRNCRQGLRAEEDVQAWQAWEGQVAAWQPAAWPSSHVVQGQADWPSKETMSG